MVLDTDCAIECRAYYDVEKAGRQFDDGWDAQFMLDVDVSAGREEITDINVDISPPPFLLVSRSSFHIEALGPGHEETLSIGMYCSSAPPSDVIDICATYRNSRDELVSVSRHLRFPISIIGAYHLAIKPAAMDKDACSVVLEYVGPPDDPPLLGQVFTDVPGVSARDSLVEFNYPGNGVVQVEQTGSGVYSVSSVDVCAMYHVVRDVCRRVLECGGRVYCFGGISGTQMFEERCRQVRAYVLLADLGRNGCTM